MADIALLLFLCFGFWSFIALFFPKTAFFLPQNNRTRGKAFFSLFLISINMIFVFGFFDDIGKNRTTPYSMIILFLLLLSCTLYYFYRLQQYENKKLITSLHIPEEKQTAHNDISTERLDSESHAKNLKKPAIWGKTKVESFSEDTIYDIDMDNLSCTCPDWGKNRTKFSSNFPSRLCKHLVHIAVKQQEILNSELKKFSPLILHYAAGMRGMPYADENYKVEYGNLDGKPYVLTQKKGSSWVNLVVSSKEYGFNFSEQRWARQINPENAKKWEKIINDFGKKPYS